MVLLRRIGGTVARLVRRVPLTPLGWSTVVVTALVAGAAARLDWQELVLVACTGAAALVLAAAVTVGRGGFSAGLAVTPHRVAVGGTSVAEVVTTNTTARRRLPARVEVAVGAGVAVVEVPSLGGGASHTDGFLVPTARRGVIPIGPATFVRADPVGLVRREAALSEQLELIVHPATTRLDGLTSGWVRDLEGRESNERSPSDVAFHTLREYVAGDDRRHIHWRSSAHSGELMVRQFVDSRRTRLALVLSTDPSEYASPDELELAISVAASVGRNALVDDQMVDCVAGGGTLPTATAVQLLDALAGLRTDPGGGLREAVRRARREAASTTVALLIGGSVPPVSHLAHLARSFGSTRVIGIRCADGGQPSTGHAGTASVLTIGRLDDLARRLRSVGAPR